MSDVRIGISGWTYSPWRKTFFPADLPQRAELDYASRQVRSIEINGTFYSLQRASSFGSWFERTPGDFLFAVKGPRFITHILRLKNSAIPLANFFASGVLRLGPKLGPILWQIPPSLRFNAAQLSEFFRLLPRDTRAAMAMAKQHNEKVRFPWLGEVVPQPLRHALEVRHETFKDPAFVELLREHDIALVIADTAGKWPFMEDVTADFIYIRLHGDSELYVSGYTEDALAEWARKIRAWRKGSNPRGARLAARPMEAAPAGRDVYAYFDNDVKTRAPYDAMNLAHRLGLGPMPGEAPPIESIKEKPRTIWPSYPSARQGRAGLSKSKPAKAKPRKSPARGRTNAAMRSP
ncbi:MAG: hypothetical protein JWM32_2626 [Verrucomicrobia bacterium]|nr:hypothetical protein [Verrucomicrobiota bacterium]